MRLFCRHFTNFSSLPMFNNMVLNNCARRDAYQPLGQYITESTSRSANCVDRQSTRRTMLVKGRHSVHLDIQLSQRTLRSQASTKSTKYCLANTKMAPGDDFPLAGLTPVFRIRLNQYSRRKEEMRKLSCNRNNIISWPRRRTQFNRNATI